MRGEDASVRRRTGEWEVVYESSVPVCCGEGESGERLSCGDTLPLVKRTADAKLERTSLSTGGLQGHPSESLSPSSPGRLSTGLKTQGK